MFSSCLIENKRHIKLFNKLSISENLCHNEYNKYVIFNYMHDIIRCTKGLFAVRFLSMKKELFQCKIKEKLFFYLVLRPILYMSDFFEIPLITCY
jgi:hypothetical protein